MKKKIVILFLFLFVAAAGCIKVKHEMIIQPIQVTVEIKVKIDKALDDFFADIDESGEEEKTGKEKEKKEEGKK
ncbi:MAG: hypothetical protein KAW12_28230 [Candidatus Aminicenantes bacterium]|nr:hypothetical protein [Candidatus Aminicenantes bacterium]